MSYNAEQLPATTVQELATAVQRELDKISGELTVGTRVKIDRFLAVAPTKPRDGQIEGADGTSWNPGSGKGVYCYYGAAWHFLG